MKAFKKGQTVIHFASWDRKGTWYFVRAIVGSCGVKQMTLLNAETDAMLGRHFRPDAETTFEQIWQGVTQRRNCKDFTLADMTDEEAHAICIKHAELELIDQRAHYANCIARSGSDVGYAKAIEKSIAELHEARSIKK